MTDSSRHTFDPLTDFCTKCGAGADYLMEMCQYNQPCPGGGNVEGISHRVRQDRVKLLADRMLEVAVNHTP